MQQRVLVVDNERFFREAIRDALTEHEIPCVVCDDAQSAQAAVAAQSFGVAVIEARLPGSQGVELLRELRGAQPDMQVIVLSSSIDQEFVLDALRAGAGEYLGKPLHEEELVLAVQRALQVNRLATDRRRLAARLDDLADHLEDLTSIVDRTEVALRGRAARDAAVRTVAHALGADKTSLLEVGAEDGALEVAAVYGRELEPVRMDRVEVGVGIAGRAFEAGTPIVVEDIRAERELCDGIVPGRYATHSCLVVPIPGAGRNLGVLCATDRSDGGPFGVEDLSVLRCIAVHLAPYLGHETRSDASQSDALDLAQDVPDEMITGSDTTGRDAELARTICDLMAHEMEPDAVMRQALGAIEASLGADPVSLYRVDPETGELVLEATGNRSLRVDRDRLPVGRGLTEGVLVRGQIVATPDPGQDPRFDASVDAPVDEKAGALLAVPLKLRGKTVGLCRAHLPLGEVVSARTGEMLAAVLSAAVRNLLLYRSLLDSIEEVAQVRRETRG